MMILLIVSPATGFVGMQENEFLSDFLVCVGFLPLTNERCHYCLFLSALRSTVAEPKCFVSSRVVCFAVPLCFSNPLVAHRLACRTRTISSCCPYQPNSGDDGEDHVTRRTSTRARLWHRLSWRERAAQCTRSRGHVLGDEAASQGPVGCVHFGVCAVALGAISCERKAALCIESVRSPSVQVHTVYLAWS